MLFGKDEIQMKRSRISQVNSAYGLIIEKGNCLQAKDSGIVKRRQGPIPIGIVFESGW